MERADYERWSAKDVARLLALVETGRRYYQEIVAVSPFALLVVSADLSIVMANRRFREMFDLRGQDLSKRTVEEVFPVEGIRKRVMDVLASGEGQRDLSVEIAGEGEAARPLRLDIEFHETWEDDKDAEVLIFAQEVTVREKRIEVVKEAPLPEVPAIFWEADPVRFTHTFVSPAAGTLLGRPAEQWLARGGMYPERIHPDDRDWVLEAYRAVAKDGADRKCEYRALTASGDVVWLREVVHAVRGEQGRIEKISGVAIDNTEHRRLFEQSIEASKMEALTRLASRVGHDFNNLLMIVAGYGEELLNGLSPKDPLRAEVEEILNATDRVSRLTNQLLSFSRRLGARPRSTDLTALLSGVIQRLRAAVPPSVKLETDLPTGPVQVEVDPNLVEQAVSDLAGSMESLMPEGGTLTVSARTVALQEYGGPGLHLSAGRYAEVTIGGDGAFDDETRHRLFEPFGGVRELGKEPGLGLANTYRIIQEAGGDIWVATKPGQGTTLRVYLPLPEEQGEPEALIAGAAPEPVPSPAPPERQQAQEAFPQEAAAPPQEEAAVAPSLPEPVPAPLIPDAIEIVAEPQAKPAFLAGGPEATETVMVVEDEEGVRALMQKILRRQGYRVIEACNGAEALDVAREHEGTIHLLVTDVVMPQMGGRALAEQLKSLRPDVRVLYVSGFTDDAVIQSGLLPPGTAFLQKPFTLNSLLTKVREVLSGAHSGPVVQ